MADSAFPIIAAKMSQFMTEGTSPTVTLYPNVAGSGASYSILGNAVAGNITVTTGTGLLATGKVLRLNYGMTFPTGSIVLFSARNAAFSLIGSMLYAPGDTTGCDLYVRTNLLPNNTAHEGSYLIVGW